MLAKFALITLIVTLAARNRRRSVPAAEDRPRAAATDLTGRARAGSRRDRRRRAARHAGPAGRGPAGSRPRASDLGRRFRDHGPSRADRGVGRARPEPVRRRGRRLRHGRPPSTRTGSPSGSGRSTTRPPAERARPSPGGRGLVRGVRGEPDPRRALGRDGHRRARRRLGRGAAGALPAAPQRDDSAVEPLHRPPKYTMDVPGGSIRISPDPERPGPSEVHVNLYSPFDKAPAEQIVVSGSAVGEPLEEWPLTRLTNSKYIAHVELEPGPYTNQRRGAGDSGPAPARLVSDRRPFRLNEAGAASLALRRKRWYERLTGNRLRARGNGCPVRSRCGGVLSAGLLGGSGRGRGGHRARRLALAELRDLGQSAYAVPLVTDTNPDPKTVETTLTADEADVDIAATDHGARPDLQGRSRARPSSSTSATT